MVRVEDGLWSTHTSDRVIVKLDLEDGTPLDVIEVPEDCPEPHGLSIHGDEFPLLRCRFWLGSQNFYTEIQKRWNLLTLQGWETKEIRDRLGLKKSSDKKSETFAAHCGSWCLAVGGTAYL